MDIFESDKLLLFIAFVVPGFISLKSYQVAFPSTPMKTADQLIDAVTYSCINYAFLFWPILEIERRTVSVDHPTLYALFYVFVLLVAPILWVSLLWSLRATEIVQRFLPHPTPKPWDFVFRKRKPFWIIVTLKDGKQIAGRYASNSFASSSPAADQIFLEEAWLMNSDGGFDRKRTNSAGILVLTAEMTSIEFFH